MISPSTRPRVSNASLSAFDACHDRVMLFHTNRGGIVHNLRAGASLIFDGILLQVGVCEKTIGHRRYG